MFSDHISLLGYRPSRHMTSTCRPADVDVTSTRRIDVNTTSFQRCVPAGVGLYRDYGFVNVLRFTSVRLVLHTPKVLKYWDT